MVVRLVLLLHRQLHLLKVGGVAADSEVELDGLFRAGAAGRLGYAVGVPLRQHRVRPVLSSAGAAQESPRTARIYVRLGAIRRIFARKGADRARLRVGSLALLLHALLCAVWLPATMIFLFNLYFKLL